MDWFLATFLVTALAMALERVVGYPDALFRRIGHPVTWMGAFLSRAERRGNHGPAPARRRAGLRALLVLVTLVLVVTLPLQWLGVVVCAALASSLIAQRSLAQHVVAVASGLEQGLDQGRAAVAMIVGRDVAVLDQGGVARAAIESLSENFSDGVVAPVFWMAVGGLPGAAVYKAINTADSMIGHKTPRYLDYGRCAAITDDWVNLPASRLSGVLLIGAAALTRGASARGAWRAMRRDARAHKSPNAGWPEAAMAGALGISLAGARQYDGVMVQDAEMNAGARRDLGAADIHRALALYWRADALLGALTGGVALALWWALI
jgi:adenosylcobinamide-phosphate synthase